MIQKHVAPLKPRDHNLLRMSSLISNHRVYRDVERSHSRADIFPLLITGGQMRRSTAAFPRHATRVQGQMFWWKYQPFHIPRRGLRYTTTCARDSIPFRMQARGRQRLSGPRLFFLTPRGTIARTTSRLPNLKTPREGGTIANHSIRLHHG